MTANPLMHATASAFAANQITRQQHDELEALAALDWSLILKALPMLATFFPALAPFLPILTWIVDLVTNGLNVKPPNGGGSPDPN